MLDIEDQNNWHERPIMETKRNESVATNWQQKME